MGLLLSSAVWAAGADANAPALEAEKAVEDENSRQLRIYGDALLHGVTEAIRLDAATGLLARKDTAATYILLQAFSTPDNPMARMAVCRSLVRRRSLGTAAGSLDVFLTPLIEMLKNPDVPLARVAAEALLVFRYEQIAGPLSELVQSAMTEKQARLNVIYVFQIRPEPEALRNLIGLLNDSDADVVRAAELALQESFGMPVGTSKEVWSKVFKELEQKDPTEIRRERLLRQETRLREIQAERDRWQKLYMGALDKEFEPLDAAAKTACLLERLGSDVPAIRLWALDKLQRYPAESTAGLRDKLLSLLSDENRQVRMATAGVLSTMSALNPAERLLERYKEETDSQVAVAIFDALGEACFFAFSPGSKITLPAEIKTQTMQIAEKYTSKEEPETAKKGAEVLRKLLELDGLTPKENQHYMQVILDRYTVETQRKGPIRGELLTAMARLCGQGGLKIEAGKLYSAVFVETLRTYDENNLVRQAAATGMVNADRTVAMPLFRELNLQTDASPAVQLIVIDLAGQVGATEDLEWLSAQLNSNGQSEPAWRAIVAILQRQDAGVIAEWAGRMEQNPAIADQVVELLELAEQKAAAQKEETLLCDLQVRLLKWYWNKGQYEQVLVYRDKLSHKDGDKEYAQSALRQTDSCVLEAYLQLRQFSQAAAVMGERLKQNLLTQTSEMLEMVEAYIVSEKTSVEDKKNLLGALAEVSISSEQSWWLEKLEQWRGLLTPVSVPSPAKESQP
jgi:hypothetical protein